MISTMYGTGRFCYNILTTILQNKFFFQCFLEFQHVLLMEIQKLTRTQNEILEQLRLLPMDNTVVTQNMDALEPVTTMQEFDIEEDNLKDQLNRKRKVVKLCFFFFLKLKLISAIFNQIFIFYQMITL